MPPPFPCSLRGQGLFALANVVLKVKRYPIKRVERAKLWHLVAGLTFAIWGITGTILRSVSVFGWFVRNANHTIECTSLEKAALKLHPISRTPSR